MKSFTALSCLFSFIVASGYIPFQTEDTSTLDHFGNTSIRASSTFKKPRAKDTINSATNGDDELFRLLSQQSSDRSTDLCYFDNRTFQCNKEQSIGRIKFDLTESLKVEKFTDILSTIPSIASSAIEDVSISSENVMDGNNNNLQAFLNENNLADYTIDDSIDPQTLVDMYVHTNIGHFTDDDPLDVLSLTAVSEVAESTINGTYAITSFNDDIPSATTTAYMSSTINEIPDLQIRNTRQAKRKDDEKDDFLARLADFEKNLYNSCIPMPLAPDRTIHTSDETALAIMRVLAPTISTPSQEMQSSTSIEEFNPPKRQKTSQSNRDSDTITDPTVNPEIVVIPNTEIQQETTLKTPLRAFENTNYLLEEEVRNKIERIQQRIATDCPLYTPFYECVKNILFSRLSIRGILLAHAERMCDIRRRLKQTEVQTVFSAPVKNIVDFPRILKQSKEQMKPVRSVFPKERSLIKEPAFYNLIRLGLDTIGSFQPNNTLVFYPSNFSEGEAKGNFSTYFKKVILYNRANFATIDKFLAMLSFLTDLVDFFKDFPPSFKAQLPAPPMPEMASVWHDYSHVGVPFSNKDFLYYWFADWMLYLSSLKATTSFIRGRNTWFSFDLKPNGLVVKLAVSLFSLLVDNSETQHVNNNPTLLDKWMENVSIAFRSMNPNFERLFGDLSIAIAPIREIWMNQYRTVRNLEIANIEDLDPILSKYFATIYYLVEEALLLTIKN